jgi:hypothetical protein
MILNISASTRLMRYFPLSRNSKSPAESSGLFFLLIAFKKLRESLLRTAAHSCVQLPFEL